MTEKLPAALPLNQFGAERRLQLVNKSSLPERFAQWWAAEEAGCIAADFILQLC